MKREAVIFDIDDVLCNSSEYVRPILERCAADRGVPPEGVSTWDHYTGHPAWEDYNPVEAKANEGWAALCRILYQRQIYIIILTARNDNDFKRTQTIQWLNKCNIPFDRLEMWDGTTPFDDYKRIRCEALSEEFNIVLAIDDHPPHCEGYRGLNIPFLHAHPDALR